jgi:hypothetical protein
MRSVRKPDDDDEGEPGEGEVRGAAAAPAGLQPQHEVRRVDGDRGQRRGHERIEAPSARAQPDKAEPDPGRQRRQ